MIVFQVAGFSNAGKTTVTAQLVKALTDMKLRTATVKHHGHADTLPAPDYNKDTWKHRQAGAETSLAITDTAFQLTGENTHFTSLETWLEVYKLLAMDVVLVEGYKYADYPKVLIVREEDCYEELFNTITNIQAILFTDEAKTTFSEANFNGYFGSVFNTEGFIDWFIEEYTVKGE